MFIHMAASFLVSIPPCQASSTVTTRPTLQRVNTNPSSIVIDRTFGSAANLVKLLPCGTIMAFLSLSASFSNRGTCHTSNKYLTGFLIGLCTFSCWLFCFTDSFVAPNGKLYYGIATIKGMYIFNYDYGKDGEKNMTLIELGKYRLRIVDFIHALLSCLVFVSLALSVSDVQDCFFRDRGVNMKELLANLPLAIGLLASLVFVVFPTTRKGIGYSNPRRVW